jgi:hypothetical protein
MPSLKSFFFLARIVPRTRSLSHYPPPSTGYPGTRATEARHLGLKISPRAHCLNAVADNHFSRATLIPVNVSTKFTCSAGWREEGKCRKQFHFKNIGTFPRQGLDANPHSNPTLLFRSHCIRVRRRHMGMLRRSQETLRLDVTKFVSYNGMIALGISDCFTLTSSL